MNNIKRLWQAIQQSGQGVYAPALARQQLTVVSVETDSNGAVTTARGTIGGEGDFSVPVRGEGVRVGMLIGVTQPAHDPSAPLAFDGIDATDDPTAGFFDIDPELPAPVFTGAGYTTSIVKSPASVTAQITVTFTAVTEKYKPSGYLISYRYPSGTGDWKDEYTLHLGGAQVFALPGVFPPGATVDLKLRTRYDWAHAYSVASGAITATAAADNASPGTATTVTIDNSVAGQLICTVTASTLDADLFLDWRYEFSTSPTGPASASVVAAGPAVFIGAAGTWYVRAAPRSKSHTIGTYTAWTATTITVAAAPNDTTPPPAFNAPTLTQRSVTDANGTIRYFIKVTLPAYSFPADYAYTEVSLSDGTNPPLLAQIKDTDTTGEWVVVPGTWTIGLRGVDKPAGNRQATFGTTASITVTAIGTPATMSAPTVTAKAGAMLISWTRPTDAKWVRVTRATSSGGAGATVLGIFDSTSFLDILFTNADVSGGYPTWYYATTGVNLDSSGAIRAGTISAYTGAAVLETHGSWLGADTITAREILANTITANEIAATLTVSGNTIRTAAAPNTRVALEGASNRLAFYENVLGTEFLRAWLKGSELRFFWDNGVSTRLLVDPATGLTLYDNAGVPVAYMQVSGGSPAILLTNLLITPSVMRMDPAMQVAWHQPGNTAVFDTYMVRAAAGEIEVTSTLTLDGGVLNLAANHDTYLTRDAAGRVEIFDNLVLNGGILYLHDNLSVYLRWDPGTSSYSMPSAPTRLQDIYSIRSTASNGVIFLGDQSGGTRQLFYNGTNYVMPGVQAVISGVTVGSDITLKSSVRRASLDLKKAHTLRASTFTLKGDKAKRQRLGFVAQDVLAAIPEAHHELGGEGEPPSGYDLAAVVAAQQEMIVDLGRRLDALEARG